MDLEDRLVSLGEHLAVGDDEGDTLAEQVTTRLNGVAVEVGQPRGRWVRFAAALLLAVAIAAAAVPASRDTVAGWFGLDGVRIERGQDVETPVVPPVETSPETSLAVPVDADVSGLPGPGASREATVDGRIVLVSVIEGELTSDVLVKTLGEDTQIVEVVVGDAPGLWISGAPHELAYQSPDGLIAFERVAGNTLVWQDDEMIGRLEGFGSVDAAIEFAVGVGTND